MIQKNAKAISIRPLAWFEKLINSQPESERVNCKEHILDNFLTDTDTGSIDSSGDVESRWDAYSDALKKVSSSSSHLFICDQETCEILGVSNPRSHSGKSGRFPTKKYYFNEEFIKEHGNKNPQLPWLTKVGTKKFRTITYIIADSGYGINSTCFMQNLRMASNPLLKQEPFGHCSAAAGVSSDAQMPSPSVSEADINIANSNSSCVSERLQKILEVNIGICPKLSPLIE